MTGETPRSSSSAGPRRAASLLAAGVLALTLAPASASALGRAGDLDPTFHGGSPTVVNLARTAPYITGFSSVLVDASGRIVAAGDATDPNGIYAAAAARFDGDGNLDGSFGQGGGFVQQLGSGTNQYSFAQSLFAVPGHYVGFSAYRIVNGRAQPSAFELRENGTPDLDLGSGGLLTTDPATPPAYANTDAGAAGPDGSVYVTGVLEQNPGVGGNRLLALTKFGPTGQVVSSFGNRAGTWTGSFSESRSDAGTYGAALVVLPSSRILVGGIGLLPTGRFGAMVARFSTTSGFPDTSFGTRSGATVFDASDPSIPFPDSTVEHLAVAPDGAIYGAGYGEDAQGRTAVMVARLSPSGILDSTWGSGGVKRIQLATGDSRSSADGLVLQDDGKVVVSADISDGAGHSETRVLRLRDDGTLDPTFGDAGVANPQVGEGFGGGAVTISGGRLLIAGSVRSGARTVGVVARMLLAPLPDPPPGGGGGGSGGGGGGGTGGGGSTTPPPSGGRKMPAPGTARLGATRLHVDRRGRVRVPLGCPRGGGVCAGTLALVGTSGRATISAHRRGRRARRVRRATIYARARYRVAAGRSATIVVRLSRAARTRAASRRGLSARLLLLGAGARRARTFGVRLTG